MSFKKIRIIVLQKLENPQQYIDQSDRIYFPLGMYKWLMAVEADGNGGRHQKGRRY